MTVAFGTPRAVRIAALAHPVRSLPALQCMTVGRFAGSSMRLKNDRVLRERTGAAHDAAPTVDEEPLGLAVAEELLLGGLVARRDRGW